MIDVDEPVISGYLQQYLRVSHPSFNEEGGPWVGYVLWRKRGIDMRSLLDIGVADIKEISQQ